MHHLERKVLIGLLFGVLVYAALTIWTDAESLHREVLRFHWSAFALALGLAFCNYLVRFVKWQYYLRLLRIQVPMRQSFLVFLSSLMLTVTPGKVGEVLKSYLLKRSRGISISVTAPIVIAERLTDLLALLCLTLVGISTYTYGLKALVVTGALVLALLLLLSAPTLTLQLIDWLTRFPVLGRVAPKIRTAYQSMRVMATPRPLFLCTFLSIGAWWLECLAFYLVIRGFDVSQPSLISCTFLYAFTTILGAISFLPGGLGVTEGSMSVGLTEMNLLPETAVAVAATVIIRFATLWFAVLLGVGAFVLYRRLYLSGTDLAADPDVLRSEPTTTSSLAPDTATPLEPVTATPGDPDTASPPPGSASHLP